MPEEMKDQIDAMLNIGDPAVTDAPITESVSTESPTTEAPSSEAPQTKSPSTDAPTTKAPTTEAPTEDTSKKLEEENEVLRRKLEELQRTPKAPKTELPSTEAPFEEVSFLTSDIDIDELTRDTKALNKLLNKVYKAGVDASRDFQESTLKNIPEIVKSNVLIQATLKKKVEDFYSGNEDLRPFKKAVATIYEEIAAENPDWKIDDVFNEVEKETRHRLELHKKATSTEAPTTKAPNPRFPKARGVRRKAQPKTSPLLSEIDKMNESL